MIWCSPWICDPQVPLKLFLNTLLGGCNFFLVGLAATLYVVISAIEARCNKRRARPKRKKDSPWSNSARSARQSASDCCSDCCYLPAEIANVSPTVCVLSLEVATAKKFGAFVALSSWKPRLWHGHQLPDLLSSLQSKLFLLLLLRGLLWALRFWLWNLLNFNFKIAVYR